MLIAYTASTVVHYSPYNVCKFLDLYSKKLLDDSDHLLNKSQQYYNKIKAQYWIELLCICKDSDDS